MADLEDSANQRAGLSVQERTDIVHADDDIDRLTIHVAKFVDLLLLNVKEPRKLVVFIYFPPSTHASESLPTTTTLTIWTKRRRVS